MFTPIGTLIKSLPRRSRTPEVILALQVREVAWDILRKTLEDFRPEVSNLVRVTSFKNRSLTISAPAIVCTELKMRSGGLIEGINGALGRRLVEKIRFRVC